MARRQQHGARRRQYEGECSQHALRGEFPREAISAAREKNTTKKQSHALRGEFPREAISAARERNTTKKRSHALRGEFPREAISAAKEKNTIRSKVIYAKTPKTSKRNEKPATRRKGFTQNRLRTRKRSYKKKGRRTKPYRAKATLTLHPCASTKRLHKAPQQQ